MRDLISDNFQSSVLIGVANVSLNSLLEDCVFDYNVPILSQQGEVAGCLKIQIKHESIDASDDSAVQGLSSATLTNSSYLDNTSENLDSDMERSTQQKVIKCIVSSSYKIL